MNNRRNIFIIGQESAFLQVLLRVLSALKNSYVKLISTEQGEDFCETLSQTRVGNTVLVIDAAFDVKSVVVEWLWRRLRRNAKAIGKKVAGSPVILLGMEGDLLQSPEGKVFRDSRCHHRYFRKPFDLRAFLTAVDEMSPISSADLPVIIANNCPDSLEYAYEHDLILVSQEFSYNGTNEDIKRRFRRVELDLDNYASLAHDRASIESFMHEKEKIRSEILSRRGDIWQERY